MAMSNLGPLIRLWGIKTDQLPWGPLVANTGNTDNESDDGRSDSRDGLGGNERVGQGNDHRESSSTEELTDFLGSLLKEAVPFIDDVAPKDKDKEEKEKQSDGGSGGDETNKRARRVWKSRGSKSYNNNNIKVELFGRVISPRELEAAASESGRPATGAETWICRRSIHEDMKEKGTASWDEFRDCFKERHPETEALFTPSVIRMNKRAVWDCEGVPPQKIGNETYSNFTLCILEARHRVGKPLKDRTFPILQMTCSAMDDTSSFTPAPATSTDTTQQQPVREHNQKEKREFLVISVTIPDYFNSSSSSFRRAESHTGSSETDHPVEKDKDTVIASYASIERIRQLDDLSSSGEGDENGKIEWLMALTSDAKGILPRWIQNLAVPGQIAKDVPLFLDWIGKERENTR